MTIRAKILWLMACTAAANGWAAAAPEALPLEAEGIGTAALGVAIAACIALALVFLYPSGRNSDSE